MKKAKRIEPKVSVAVITYNQKEFLKECIESIIAQDYINIEIVVADDGSTDGTQMMLKEYEAKYPHLFTLCLAKDNQGITKNSNRAFTACTGKYIAWVGGDDLFLPEKLSKQVNILESRPDFSMCVTAAEVFQSETNKTIKIAQSTINNLTELGPKELIQSNNCIVGSTCMVRRSMCPEAGFDHRINIASDFKFFIDLASQGNVIVLNEVLCRYRRHATNVTNNNRKILLDQLVTLQIVEFEHPNLLRPIIKTRASIHYNMALNLFADGKYMESYQMMKHSHTQNPSFKKFVWLSILVSPLWLKDKLQEKWLNRIGVSR